MSIDWLFDLERALENGKDHFAVQGTGKNVWIISRNKEDLIDQAKTLADTKGFPITVYKLIPLSDLKVGCFFLVPIKIEESGRWNEPQIQWSLVETKDAAELVRDLTYGTSPYFGAIEVATVHPTKETIKKG